MKYCLVFERTFRLGAWVARVVGPFDSIAAARDWYMEAERTWKVAPGKAEITALMVP